MDDTLPVFVDSCGAPLASPLVNRRVAVRTLFPMSVLRLELCKLVKVELARTRLWLANADSPGEVLVDSPGEVLVDLERTPAENGVVAGSKLLLEVALESGEWLRSISPLTASRDREFVRRSEEVWSAATQQAAGGQGDMARALADALKDVKPPPAKTHLPSHSATQQHQRVDDELEAAMAMTRETQRVQLAAEEQLHIALALDGRKVKRMSDDGNCLFHALAYLLWGSANRHDEMRALVCSELLEHPERYDGFVPGGDLASHVAVMSCDGTYGTHLEIQACANKTGARVMIYSDEGPFVDSLVVPIVVDPHGGVPGNPTLRISYQRGNHYNCVVPYDDNDNDDAQPMQIEPRGNASLACPYCGVESDDVDLHMVTSHADMF